MTNPPNFTEEEWPQVGMLIELLRPFQVATAFFSTQNCPTISVMLHIIHNLEHHLKGRKHDQELVAALKPELQKHLNEVKSHWARLGDIQLLAALLDPRTKVPTLTPLSLLHLLPPII